MSIKDKINEYLLSEGFNIKDTTGSAKENKNLLNDIKTILYKNKIITKGIKGAAGFDQEGTIEINLKNDIIFIDTYRIAHKIVASTKRKEFYREEYSGDYKVHLQDILDVYLELDEDKKC